MRPEVAQRRVQAFRERFGEAHFALAIHAAFPLALTPDLLYRLWANFQQDIHGEVLNIPWLAVSDLLLCSLCNEVGHELYEMPKEVRNNLLTELKAHSRFGSQRIHELSDFLLTHIKQQLESHDPDIRDFAQVQRWIALTYAKPDKVAEEISSVFTKLSLEDRTEWIRMKSLVEAFPEALQEFEPLLQTAQRMTESIHSSFNEVSPTQANAPDVGNEITLESLQSLQQQLEQFRAASQDLQIEPLVTQEKLKRLGVDYQTKLIDELEQAIDDAPSLNEKLIFTGHRGCGKTTLLAELKFRLIETGRYFVVMFSIADTIERSAVNHVTILFSMAVQMLEAAEKAEVKLKPGIKKRLYGWLGKHTKVESQDVEAEIEAREEASVKGGIPLITEFLAAIKSTLKVNSVVGNEISTAFDRKISDLITQINVIQIYISNATGQRVLVIIDDLDKLDLSVTESIFSKNIQPLLDPGFQILYTIPIATLREVSLKRGIEAYVKQIHTMRVAKFFSKAMVRNPDRTPDAAYVALFEEVIDKRLPAELIDPAVKKQMILKSGGVLRELIRIVDRCCDICMQEIRRRIRDSIFDKPPVIIDQQVLDTVLTDLQIGYAKPLGKIDFALLKSTYEEFKPQDVENQRFLDLLHGLYVLEYYDATLWYDLNPIVADLLQTEGILDC